MSEMSDKKTISIEVERMPNPDTISIRDWNTWESGVIQAAIEASKNESHPQEPSELEPKAEIVRHEVVDDHWGFLCADGRVLGKWEDHRSFRGAVYRHPNGTERVFGFVHPIWVSDCDRYDEWMYSTCKVADTPTMLRPVAILEEVQNG